MQTGSSGTLIGWKSMGPSGGSVAMDSDIHLWFSNIDLGLKQDKRGS